MDHVNDIECLLKTLVGSPRFHALVIESPAGWGKSSTLERAVTDLKLDYHAIGSYVTPLALYNAFISHPKSVLVLDDCAGLFGDAIGMALLKAASWCSAGTHGERLVTWNSTSERIAQPTIAFSGKIVLLANAIPKGRDTRAFLSRTLYLQVRFNGEKAAEMLNEASRQTDFFEDQETAQNVAKFLSDRVKASEVNSINLRTLQMGYELARANPTSWETLLAKLVSPADPRYVIEDLAKSDLLVEEQFREFSRITGLSRRTFFKYRKENLLDKSPEI